MRRVTLFARWLMLAAVPLLLLSRALGWIGPDGASEPGGNYWVHHL